MSLLKSLKLTGLLLLISLISTRATAITKQTVIIPFGKTGSIRYDLLSGKLEVFESGKKIIANGTMDARYLNTTLNTSIYKNRTSSSKKINDEFGRGVKTSIEYQSEGKPTIRHNIYTYVGKPFFLIDLTIEGFKLKSNYMVPLVADVINPEGKLKQRSLFVPFDNDAWIRYDAKEFKEGVVNISSEIGTVYEETSGKGLVIGSVEHQVWKSAIKTKASSFGYQLSAISGYTDKDVTRDQHEHGFLVNNQLKSAKFMVGYFSDWREGLEEYAKANRLAEKPFVFNWNKPTPVGWNSWGVVQQNINYENATGVVDFFADSLQGFRNGKDFFIDLDSYWDNMIKGGLEGDFSELKGFAEYCVKRGLQPGVYWAPFTDWGFKSGGQRRMEGTSYVFGDAWTKVNGGYHDFDGARALDPTHPGTRERIKLVISKLKACGFKMIKIDFLGHAAIEADSFYDKNISTGMQAYRSGMEYLVNQLDNKMLIYAAISPTMASGRYVHARRIACDAFKAINETEYTLNSLTYGWWQTNLYNYVDADHVVLATESYGENRARTLSAVITGTFITGDDFSTPGIWRTRAKELFQKDELLELVADGKAFRPLVGNTGKSACEVFWKKIGRFCYFAVFNYEASDKELEVDLSKTGLSGVLKSNSMDIFSGKAFALGIDHKIKVPAKDALLLKIEL
ncbi:alpha-galactosidase [Desertivirga arenae]|uniref:alpha-galactosidase n=1 Tax=Desertivirga arenae TaxID=2810309 RepID=UPI001A95A887|nr:alpha-galactosidase [Pedobacter sp. SYSU D00823]